MVALRRELPAGGAARARGAGCGSEKELWEQLSLARDMGVLTPEDEEAAAVLTAQGGDRCASFSQSSAVTVRSMHGCLWSCQWSMVSQHKNVVRDSGTHSAQDPAGAPAQPRRAPQANEFWAVFIMEHFELAALLVQALGGQS